MEFTLKVKIQASPKEVYEAWLNSEGHSKMTGGVATASNKVGDRFTAWDGYIQGTNLELDPNKRIVQSWRTTPFSNEAEDSRLEILLTEVYRFTELTLIHTNLPEDGEQYRKGWDVHYFQPMTDYFSER